MNSSISECSVSNFRHSRQNASLDAFGIKPCWVVVERFKVDFAFGNIVIPNSAMDEKMARDIKTGCITTREHYRDDLTSDIGSFLCEGCGTAFAQERDLKIHTQDDCSVLNTSHENSAQSDVLICDNITVLCEHCGTPVQDKDLKSHMESDCIPHVSLEKSESSSVERRLPQGDSCESNSVERRQPQGDSCESNSVERRQPQGDSCEKHFNRTRASRKHIEKAQPKPEVKEKAKKEDTPELALFCDFCGKSFSTRVRSLNDTEYYVKYSVLQGVCRDCNLNYREYFSFDRCTSNFKCSRCGVCYKHVPWLKNHVRAHAKVDVRFGKSKQFIDMNATSSKSQPGSSGFKGRTKALEDPFVTSKSPSASDEVVGTSTVHAVEEKSSDSEDFSPSAESQSASDDSQERTASAAAEHSVKEAPVSPEVITIEENDSNTEFALFCEFCGKFFMTKVSLLDESEYYTKYSQLQGVCSDCNKAYQKYYKFNKKTGDFICKRCGTSYKKASWLKIHILGHAKIDSRAVPAKQPVVENLLCATESSSVSSDRGGGIASHAVRSKQSCENLPSTSEPPPTRKDWKDSLSTYVVMAEHKLNESPPSHSQAPSASGDPGERMSVSFSQPSLNAEDDHTNEAGFTFAPFFVDCEIKVDEELSDPPSCVQTLVQPSSSAVNEHTSNEAGDVSSVSEFLTFLNDSSVNIGKQFDFVSTEKKRVVKTRKRSADPSSLQNSRSSRYDTSVITKKGFDSAKVRQTRIDSDSPHNRQLSSNDSIDIETEIDPAALVELVVKMDENATDSSPNQDNSVANSDSGNHDELMSSHGVKPCSVSLERIRTDPGAQSSESDLKSDVEHPSPPPVPPPACPPKESPPFADFLSSLDVPEDPGHFMHYLCQTDDVMIDRTQCTECGKIFKRPYEWRNHVEKVHNMQPYKDPDMFHCPRCAKPIKYRKAYENHLIQHVELDKLVAERGRV